MSTLLEKPIQINRIVTTSTDHARAIEDPARAKIVQSLYCQQRTAEQITKLLNRSGHKKALTTVRHHLEILRTAGLIQVAKIEETRGAITKYYGTSTRLIGYNAPEDFDLKYSSAIKNTTKKLEDILKTLAPKAAPKTKKEKSNPAFSQSILMEIMNRATTRIIEETYSPNKKD